MRALEDGDVLYLPHLGFSIEPDEIPLLSSDSAAKSKNISLGAAGGVHGSSLDGAPAGRLEALMRRFVRQSRDLLSSLLPKYQSAIIPGRTSFRPVGIESRSTSWRKDDTRLHVDSFPSSPVQGRRILRFFSNINPDGRPRTWRLGGRFEGVVTRFLPALSAPMRGSSRLLELIKVTRGRRSAYDHFMLQLHDRMKADAHYQAETAQIRRDFPAGSTWIVFTDCVPHAAIAGQHALEQTYYLPVDAMADSSKSPLRVLERRLGRRLV